MAEIDVGTQRQSLLDDAITFDQLPPELVHIIRTQASANLLDAVAQAALIPRLTGRIYAHFEVVFADICARWVSHSPQSTQDEVLSSFGRILPFSPSLSVFLDQYLKNPAPEADIDASERPFFSLSNSTAPSPATENLLLSRLLTSWRLISFDKRVYSHLVPLGELQSLFKHRNGAIRYMAIRLFCEVLDVSDYRLEALIRQYIPDEASLVGDFDGQEINYTFLTLCEHQRAEAVHNLSVTARQNQTTLTNVPSCRQTLTQFVVRYGKILLPRPAGPPSRLSNLIPTTTTLQNLEGMAKLLQESGPILIHGLPGAGKTSLVHEAARELGMDSGMVTLHLNEQTDAKMLIGLYATDTKPGSFQWRPGILTTAVKEGRWVLIEDLDRAPNEVMSTLLPLVEDGELLIPSRGERIRAHRNFRILATVRTSLGMNGQESLPSLLGLRFWHQLSVHSLPEPELRQIVETSHPLLRGLLPDIIRVYDGVRALLRHPASIPGISSANERPINARDLFKWCRRLDETVRPNIDKDGELVITEKTLDWILMEALDCFTGGIKDDRLRNALVYRIGELLGKSNQRVEHYLTSHTPRLEERENRLAVGRVTLSRIKRPNHLTKSKRPFATTVHARRILEQIAVAVKLQEPVLLVGETGIGKTTVVQQLAESLGHKLVAINLSQQSEVSDLLGGFKPVNVRTLAVPLKEEFEDLFVSTGISTERNQQYLNKIAKNVARGKWSDVAKLWRQAPKMFDEILQRLSQAQTEQKIPEDGQPAKRRKTESTRLQTLRDLKPRWDKFRQGLEQFEIQISGGGGAFAFAFVEGNMVKAVRNGDWVLLDEINLASPDTLESIADLLQPDPNTPPSILLSETGEIERTQAHPNFRIFGAMNPATDVGKRDLPLGIRSRFTELYVPSPDKDFKDLVVIIKSYLKGNSSVIDQAADNVARLYTHIKVLAETKALVDGANEVPHFSLRTLTRVLTYVNDIAPFYGLERALYEGFCMGFLTLLSQESEKLVMPIILDILLGKNPQRRQTLLSQPIKHPNDGRQHIKFTNKEKDRQYWLVRGDEAPLERTDYIRTQYVERNLLNLVRATSTRRFPILIQGPTSSGKTSMIEYLSNYSGNKFVRINNHEHTDLQEYLGTYVSGSDGKLRFQEGLLVQAMRQGHWIVLDELNLAPTDVLEALNRLLDENRELLIPETQEVVRPHDNFMLFATQNPPGLYGGRKVLSRAFRNRFLELHFDDIPEDELEYILQKRSVNTSPSDCKRIVNVYKELSRLRQTSRIFEQKDSFATLRDLFRWALRQAETREDIANNGFMLLAERVRNEEERAAVKGVIENVFKVKINSDSLYGFDTPLAHGGFRTQNNSQGVVWTNAMRRLFVLVAQALRNNEPVLLVGETGCGKTTVCQLLAESVGRDLHIVNAHQNTETGDLIGSQRPVRNRGMILEALGADLSQALAITGFSSNGTVEDLLNSFRDLTADQVAQIPETLQEKIKANATRSKALFEWSDGSLVQAMKTGQFFLLDEISLADDSVLERLNSVLEPGRTLLLAEKGIDNAFVEATNGFQFLATMNPGGDFGKKELSPALRNRFTEIWVSPLTESQDVMDIVTDKLRREFKRLSQVIVDFSYWFGRTYRASAATPFSIRDILMWVKFINEAGVAAPELALLHGAATVFIDTLGANPSALLAIDPGTMHQERQNCLNKLDELIGHEGGISAYYWAEPQLSFEGDTLMIGDFSIAKSANDDHDISFAFDAPTTKMNAMRVIRALRVDRPILLEGNPGVGKTTLVSALARACGRPLTRINLSDQTDLMDLFGTDVPVEGTEAGNFEWRDAPFLKAMQKGEWVLLDEMNLASQSVLEGLNACLDHRGEVYISELDQVFKRHPDFRLFAAQNPHHQGGGRKGLPSSFVNRFVVVYADVFTEHDLFLIASRRHQQIPSGTVRQLIDFVSKLDFEVVVRRSFGAQGAPWEFNLRDTLRWLDLLGSPNQLMASGTAADFLDVIVRQRFRTNVDRQAINRLFEDVFQTSTMGHTLYHSLSSGVAQGGLAIIERNLMSQPTKFPAMSVVPRLAEIESLMICITQDLPCILVGPSGSGKSTLLRYVAGLAGKELVTFPMNADVDAMDLVGGFEQADPRRELQASLDQLRKSLLAFFTSILPNEAPTAALDLYSLLQEKNAGISNFETFKQSVRELSSTIPAASDLAMRLSGALQLLQEPLTTENPRFEWLDGVIVRAMETGQWLVLDNANLCNASVLDRLNSLLERPNGFLSINEHTGSDGEPRIITPHAEFRIFLTMDPRYGELSRAMRNRSVEVYLDQLDLIAAPYLSRICSIESSMQRYHDLIVLAKDETNESHDMVALALDNLALEDAPKLSSFTTSIATGMPLSARSCLNNMDSLLSFQSYIESPNTSEIRQALLKLYKSLADRILATRTKAESNEMASSNAYARLFVQSQPVHPLQNSSLLRLATEEHSWDAFGLSLCLEFYLEGWAAQKAVRLQTENVDRSKPSSLNRFQRAFVSNHVASVAKDSTVQVSSFLKAMLQTIENYLLSSVDHIESLKGGRAVLRALMQYWWRTFRVVTASEFDEASFQAHLQQGLELLRSVTTSPVDERTRQVANNVLRDLQHAFVTGFALVTGLSMETLWIYFRPPLIQDEKAYKDIRRMEQLAQRFDSLKWKNNASLHDLRTATSSLLEAYHLLRRSTMDANELIQALENELVSLETTSDGSRILEPFFTNEFEILRRALLLHRISQPAQPVTIPQDFVILSNSSTISQMRTSIFDAGSSMLGSMDDLLSQSSTVHVHPWSNNLTASLLVKYDSIQSASLFTLRSLETELPIMGKALVASSEAVASAPIKSSNHVLLRLLRDVASSQGPALVDAITSTYNALMHSLVPSSVGFSSSGLTVADSAAPVINMDDCPKYLRRVLDQHFSHVITAIVASEKTPGGSVALSAIAWVHFAVGCIKLYVPDKIFDPYLRGQIERDFDNELRAKLQNKLQALRRFDALCTGQSFSQRTEFLEDEIDKLGPPPPTAQVVYRPASGELSQLQREFNNVLNATVRSDLETMHTRYSSSPTSEGARELQLVKANVVQLIERLSSRFLAYQDVTSPLVNMLRCLQVGLFLSDSIITNGVSEVSSALLTIAPFLGGTLWHPERSRSSRSVEFLSFIGLSASVESVRALSATLRQSLFENFHFFYEEWSKKLEADQKSEAAKASLYRFKGSLEDEEEVDESEFQELFPNYEVENEDRKPTSPRDVVRTQSVKLAEVHEKIFLSPEDPQTSLLSLCKLTGRKIAKESHGRTDLQANLDQALLPATLLVLDEKLDDFSCSTTSADYSFYTDGSLFEVQKLIALVNAIQLRFRELQKVDEISHLQPIADVLNGCEHVMELSHTEPLAKIIIRVEKLHEFMYEWQFGGWVSRVHTAPSLYDKLTETIVGWRRLELTTWARLFDMETKRCEADAKSWWFIAYQAVIAIPMTKMDVDRGLEDYAIQLVSDLQLFFMSATLGQFKTRLHLLRQLHEHLKLLLTDYPRLAIIKDSISNFLSLYSRYHIEVSKAIQQGRVSIDKSMKDVLLLASWKETNIEALRESSKRSHLKLFRLVRKFRDLLGRPMRTLIDQGLPTDAISTAAPSAGGPYPVPTEDKNAALLCQQLVPGWDEDVHSQRLMNANRVINVMSKASKLPDGTVQATAELDSFIDDLVSSMTALRKETPSFLTDDNKEAVQHLKSRKMRLFEETLKTVRQMGFRDNLSETVLRAQSSLATVLARTKPFASTSLPSLGASEYHFHKILDLAPRFRAAAQEHSGDLSRDRVKRSIVYLEGILSSLIKQRNHLSEASCLLEALDATVQETSLLTAANRDDVVGLVSTVRNQRQVLHWLIQILNFAQHLVDVHAKLGKINNEKEKARFMMWSDRFTDLLLQLEGLPKLPNGFSTSKQTQLEKSVTQELQCLGDDLQSLEAERPDLSFVTRQVQLWTTVTEESVEDGTTSQTNTQFSEAVLTLSKKVLDAVQRYRSATSKLPSSTDDPSWLLDYSNAVSSGVQALRMDIVANELNDCKSLLRSINFGDGVSKKMAFALLAVVLPIFQQYAITCREAIWTFAELHRSTSHLGYSLSNAFVKISSEGFCTPQEKSDETSGQSGKLESGTGLGEGEGAEDISKDVQSDEDLSELAQEPNNDAKGDIEDEKEAVDMGGDDMEGDMGSVQGESDGDDDAKSGDEQDEEDEMDEETGDVDDLDPTAVDEKMWDGDGEDAEKEQKGEKSQGQKKDDEQAAAKETGEKNAQPDEAGDEGEPEVEEELGPEQEDVGQQDEPNRQDQNVQENDTLALPEEMDLDGQDDETVSSQDDDHLDDLSNVDEGEDEDIRNMDNNSEGPEDHAAETKMEDVYEDNDDIVEQDEEEQPDAEPGMDVEPEDQQGIEETPGEEEEEEEERTAQTGDTAPADQDQAVPSDVQIGDGQDQDETNGENDADSENKAAQREAGQLGQNADDQETSGGKQGETARRDEDQSRSEEDQTSNSIDPQPFKKLGDALQKWYRNQREIQKAMDDQEDAPTQDKTESEMAKQEFQHLQNDDTAPDAQALGTATEEEVRPIDDSMAIDEEADDEQTHVLPEDKDMEEEPKDQDMEETGQPEAQEKDSTQRDESRSGVATRRGAYNRERSESPMDVPQAQREDDTVQETSTQLSVTHITEQDKPPRDYSESLQLWTAFQTKTHSLSLALTSQLRLILTPSQSTKLSGSYRTGKRLNIKKIIPYIASSYKRDKIWMRRSIPTKRAYQILLCVDDSRSMGETTSGNLALESLVMVSRSLTMLEAGQVGVLGFGADVFTAHELTEPFASQDAGAKVLQRFSFEQDRTDICLLIRRAIDQFRVARLQNTSRGAEDLWQLALILSDGLTPSSAHEKIRRLLREAMEERIMIVFIVMDDSNNKKGESVLELKEAKFVKDGLGNSNVVIERYLDTFPFQYYLIVHNLEDLPGALAGLLRTWFAEVNS